MGWGRVGGASRPHAHLGGLPKHLLLRRPRSKRVVKRETTAFGALHAQHIVSGLGGVHHCDHLRRWGSGARDGGGGVAGKPGCWH